MKPMLRVLQPGMLATVQDLGRPRFQQMGVPLGGAMDRFALIATNRLVGNPIGAAALEITGGDASFEVLTPLLVAITGADVEIMLDEQPLPTWTACFARRGQQLRIERRHWGARSYIGMSGGIDVPEMLGSRSTNLATGFGGLEGRQLRLGDTIHGVDAQLDVVHLAGSSWPPLARPAYSTQPVLRILPGPHYGYFAETAIAALLSKPWRVTQQSNRIGYRLEGATLAYGQSVSLSSHGVIPGVIQVPPDGMPILLMADAQTTGGYPVIAVVIGADLPLAAQLFPGDQLTFTHTTTHEAIMARHILDGWQQSKLVEDEIVEQLRWAMDLDVITLK